jgi:hypothetical protein
MGIQPTLSSGMPFSGQPLGGFGTLTYPQQPNVQSLQFVPYQLQQLQQVQLLQHQQLQQLLQIVPAQLQQIQQVIQLIAQQIPSLQSQPFGQSPWTGLSQTTGGFGVPLQPSFGTFGQGQVM